MRDFELQPIGEEEFEPDLPVPVASESNKYEKLIIIGIMMIPVMSIIIGLILYLSSAAETLDEPVVGPLPEGWTYDEDAELFDDLFDFPGSEFDLGLLSYTKGFGNLINIRYNDTTFYGKGREEDAEWLRLQAINNSRFQFEESDNIEVAESTAGYTRATRSVDYETQVQMQICFIKEDTYFDIYTKFQKRNENEAMEIINSIRFTDEPESTDNTADVEGMSVEEVVSAFMNELSSGDVEDLLIYVVVEDDAVPQEIVEKYEEFSSGMEIKISDVSIDEMWNDESLVAIEVNYNRNAEINGRTVSIPDQETFLVEKHGQTWLISQWGDVPQSPPSTSVPTQVPTLESSPTPIATAGPLGEIVLSEDFSSESETWPTYSDRYGIVYYHEESLRVKHRGHFIKPEFCILYLDLNNFIIESDVSLLEGNDSSWAAIACRTDFWGNGYRFMVNADGHYAIDLKFKTDESEYLAVPHYSKHLNTGYGEKNRLRVELEGSKFRFLANGQLLTEVNDATVESGAFGLGVITAPGSGSAEAMFDNVQIATLPGTEIPEEWKSWVNIIRGAAVLESMGVN